MKLFEWKRVSEDCETFLDIMYLGNFCLIRESVWCNEKDVVKNSTIIKVDICDLSNELISILKEKLSIKG